MSTPIVGIAPAYINLTRRFVRAVGPKSIAKLAEDTGVSADALEKLAETGEMDPASLMTVYSALFPEMSFIEASARMDAFGIPVFTP